jgi:hypothetical protein
MGVSIGKSIDLAKERQKSKNKFAFSLNISIIRLLIQIREHASIAQLEE